MMRATNWLMLAAIIALAGCPGGERAARTGDGAGAEANGAGSSTAVKVAAGGVARLPLAIASDDPALIALELGDPRLYALARCIELPLVRVSAAGELRPALVATWEPEEDGARWTFELVAGDAREIAPAQLCGSLLESWQAILRGEETPLQAQLADLVAGAADFRDGRALEISGITFEDPRLTIELTRPNRLLPLWIGQPGLGLSGSYGPFVIEETIAPSEGAGELVLKPNPQSLVGQPLLDELHFICEPDRAEQVALFAEGQLDAANVPPRMTVSDELSPALVRHETAAMLLCVFNYSRFPWDDGQFQSRVGLRQAMNWGLDLELLAEMNGEMLEPWPHFLPAAFRDYIDPELAQSPLYPLTPRIEEARRSMKEADHEQGIRLPRGMDLAVVAGENTEKLAGDVLDYWREIAVKMALYGEDRPSLLGRIGSAKHEIVLRRVYPAWPDPDACFYPLLHGNLAGLGGNWSWIDEDGIDAALEEAQAETDATTRRIIYRKLGRELEERALFVFLGYSSPSLLISPQLAGYQLTPYDFDASLPAQDFTRLGRAR